MRLAGPIMLFFKWEKWRSETWSAYLSSQSNLFSVKQAYMDKDDLNFLITIKAYLFFSEPTKGSWFLLQGPRKKIRRITLHNIMKGHNHLTLKSSSWKLGPKSPCCCKLRQSHFSVLKLQCHIMIFWGNIITGLNFGLSQKERLICSRMEALECSIRKRRSSLFLAPGVSIAVSPRT